MADGSLLTFDRAYGPEGSLAGVDEAGRGPLAGPVVAAVVILSLETPIDGIDDSKRLTEKKRERLYAEITSRAIAFSIARAEVSEIDRFNILRASLLAMQRAVAALPKTISTILVDGPYPFPWEGSSIIRPIIHGDAKSYHIAAASILAKVARDRIMRDLDRQYPGYDFARHKGYGTSAHITALDRLGPSPIHRRSFAPVYLRLPGFER